MHAPMYVDQNFPTAGIDSPHGGFARKGLLAAAIGLGAYLMRPSGRAERGAFLRDKLSQLTEAGAAGAEQVRGGLQSSTEQARSYLQDSKLWDTISQFTAQSSQPSRSAVLGGGLGTAALLLGMRRFGAFRTTAALAGLRYLQRRFGTDAPRSNAPRR